MPRVKQPLCQAANQAALPRMQPSAPLFEFESLIGARHSLNFTMCNNSIAIRRSWYDWTPGLGRRQRVLLNSPPSKRRHELMGRWYASPFILVISRMDIRKKGHDMSTDRSQGAPCQETRVAQL